MAPACLLIVVEPDLGTTLVVAFAVTALLIAAGMPLRYLGALALLGAARSWCCSCWRSPTSGPG